MVSAVKRTLASFGSVFVLTVLRFTSPVGGLTGSENDILLIILATLVVWIIRPAPYSVIGFLMLIGFYAVGVDSTLIFSGFSEDGFFFFLGVLLLSQIIIEVNLHVAIADVVTSRIRNAWQLALATPFVVFLMALPVPSATARSLTLKPIFTSLVDSDSNVGTHMMLSVGAINRIGSRAYLSGGLATILTASVLEQYGYSLTWTGWFMHMWAPALLFVALSTFGITLVFSNGISEIIADSQEVAYDPDGSFEGQLLNPDRKIVLVVLAIIIASWVGASFVSIPEFVPLLTVLAAGFFPPINVADKETLNELNWDLLLFFGSGLSLSAIIAETTIGQYLIESVVGSILGPSLPLWVFLLGLICFLVLIRIVLIGATYVVIVPPLVIQLSAVTGQDPLTMALVGLLAGSVVFFPVQSPATLVAFQGPYLTQRDTILAGVIMFVAVILTSFVSVFAYWPYL